MSSIKIDNFSLSYNENEVFRNFDMDIEKGKIISILGNSGTGKTTLLNAVSGLIPYEGKIEGVPQDIAYIFQNQALIPSLTVYKNIEYVLKHRIPKGERQKIILDILDMVELLDYKDFYPNQLSTGMAQRVSMARAFVYPASLILMDEPFRGLDIGLKTKLIDYFIKLWESREKRTVVFVTHSIDEALLLSDKIVVIGEKPAKVLKEFTLIEKQWGRKMGEKTLAKVYSNIYNIFSKE